jgi:chromosome partitioning protein
MLTVAVCASKGGSAKTTLTAALSVRVSEIKNSGKVAMLDLNADQASLTQWWERRGKPLSPWLHTDITDLELDLKALDRSGWTHCFIDSPPYDVEIIETIVMLSNVVVIPVKPSRFDETAIRAVVGLCLKRRKPFGLVLTAVDNRTQFVPHTDMIAARLREMGPVLATRFPHSLHYLTSLESGKTGHELEKSKEKPLAAMMDAMWGEIEKLAATRPAYVARGRANV